MSTLIIGDIHGCFAELLQLLDKAGLSAGDKIISLGDIVDRGPDSLPVVNFFRYNTHTDCVLGNHEFKHINLFWGNLKPAPSQILVIQKLSTLEYAEMVNYFESMPVYCDLPEAIVIHGMLEPDIPLEQQQKRVLIGATAGELFMKKKYPKPWYEYHHGDKPIIAGHHDYSGIGQPLIIKDKIFLIDTGCCYGKNLTALLLPEFRLISVKSLKNYWGIAMQGSGKTKGNLGKIEN